MPPKNNKKPAAKAAPTPEQLRAMGMSEEQIAELTSLRGMSAEQQKEQAAADEAKRQFDAKRRSLDKAEAAAREDIEKEEFTVRGALHFQQDDEYDAADKKSEARRREEERQARKLALEQMRQRKEELLRKQAKEREEMLETWKALPEDIRIARQAEFAAEAERKQRELQEQERAEAEQREKEENEREAKEKARRERVKALAEERARWGLGGGAAAAAARGEGDDDLHEQGAAMLMTKQSRHLGGN